MLDMITNNEEGKYKNADELCGLINDNGRCMMNGKTSPDEKSDIVHSVQK